MIVPRKYMPVIFAVGLFCCNQLEETSNEKVINLSKLTKFYFNKKEVCHLKISATVNNPTDSHLYEFLKRYNPQWAFLIRQDNTRGNQLEGDNKHFPLFEYNLIDSL